MFMVSETTSGYLFFKGFDDLTFDLKLYYVFNSNV